ncbi:MAG: hypothetical protein ACYC4P_16690 [Thermoanaerobaculia bacterium]
MVSGRAREILQWLASGAWRVLAGSLRAESAAPAMRGAEGRSPARRNELPGLLAAGILVLGTFGLVLRTPSWTVEPLLADDLDDGGQRLSERGSVSGNWLAQPDGLVLGPGGRGEVLLDLSHADARSLVAYVWMGGHESLSTELACSGDDGSWTALSRNERLVGEAFDLSPCEPASSSGQVSLRLRASVRDDARNQVLVLDRVSIARLRGFRIDSPALVFVSLQLGVVLLFTLLLRPRGGSGTGLAAFSLLLSAASLAWAAELLPGGSLPYVVAGRIVVVEGAVGLAACLAAGTASAGLRRTAGLRVATLACILAAGFALRWERLLANAAAPLYPDTETVAALAARMSSPYDTGFREPLWVWLTRGLQAIYGPAPLASRTLSILASMLLLAAAYGFLRRYTGRFSLAALTTALLAVHPFLVDSSIQGHRTELILLTLLAVLAFALSPGLGERWRVAGLALAVPMVGLTQFVNLLVAFVVLAYALLRSRMRPLAFLVPVATTAALVGPQLAYANRELGDPFAAVNVQAAFYRNHEFVRVRGTGCDGCPDAATLSTDSCAGARVSMARYIFGMHTPGEVLARLAKGARQAFVEGGLLDTLLGSGATPVRLLYFVGLAVLALSPWRELLLGPPLFLNLFAFIVPLGIDPRLLAPSIPILAFVIAVPLWLVARRVMPLDEIDGRGAPDARTAAAESTRERS